MDFAWGDAAPVDEAGLWIHAVVEERLADATTPTVLGSGLLPLSQGGLQIPTVPHGDNRVVVLEIRDGDAREISFVVYRGRSARFSLRAGETVNAQVELQLERTPQLPEADAIVVADTSAGQYVRDARIRLVVNASRASQLVVSEDRNFGTKSRTPVRGAPPFELPFDLAAKPCVAGDCPDETHTVYVKAVDALGYESHPASTTVILDRRAPTVSAGTVRVSVARARANPVTSSELIATIGSIVGVQFAASEALAKSPLLRGAAPGFVKFEERSSGQSIFRFRHVVTATTPPGLHAIVVSLEDIAGHTRTTTIAATFRVDLSTPTPPQPERLTLIREPWGRNGVPATVTVTSEPATAEAGAVAIAYDRDGPGAIELGRGDVRVDGAFGPIELLGGDRVAAYVSIADRAGNATSRVRVGRASWVATLGGKRRGRVDSNPHSFVLSQSLNPSVLQDDRISGEPAQSEIDRIASGAGAPVVVDGPRRWIRQRGSQPNQPTPRGQHLMGYDRERGRLVVMGGRTAHGTFEHDGDAWAEITPRSSMAPAERFNALVNFAPLGGLFTIGGFTGGPTSWLWDGSRWARRDLPGPQPPFRQLASMAYDSNRQRVVLFGGENFHRLGAGFAQFGDTWEFDGASWIAQTPVAAPPRRQNAAMAYHARWNWTVLFGGLGTDPNSQIFGDTWLWNGTSWTETGRGPEARDQPQMAYDEARERIVLFGGRSAAGVLVSDTWEFDGVAWQAKNVTSPPGRTGHQMTYSPLLGGVVMFGGEQQTQSLDDFWVFDGTRWRELSAPETSPGPRVNPAAAYHEAAGHVVLFGGGPGARTPVSGTWTYNGAWQDSTPASGEPPLRTSGMMAYAAASERTVLFGGRNAALTRLNDTWLWDGVRWIDAQPQGDLPAPRFVSGMAGDATGGVLLFGGWGVATAVVHGDTWRWDGQTWTEMTPPRSPAPRIQAGVAYDPIRQRTVLFGGFAVRPGQAAEYYDDLWEWDGASWTEIQPPAGPRPRARAITGAAFDARRGAVVFVGGGNDIDGLVTDEWLWDGQSWTEVPDSRLNPIGFVGFAMSQFEDHVLVYGGSAGSGGDTWTFPAPSTRPERPGAVFVVRADGAGFERGEVTALSVAARAGHRGFDGTLDQTVVIVEAWDRFEGRWHEWTRADSPPEAPVVVSHQEATPKPDRWVSEAGEVHIRLRGAADATNADRLPRFAIGSIDLRVSYRPGVAP